MNARKKVLLADGLEIITVFAILFMIISIYVPRAIWDEEEAIEKLSHFRMTNIYDIEDFYYQLAGEYTSDPIWAMNVVNAVRDSLVADSTYLEEQVLYLYDKPLDITVNKGWDVVFDTTFGFARNRKDTIEYSQFTIVNYIDERDAYDTSYVRENELAAAKENPTFVDMIGETLQERVENVEYYESYRPDSSFLNCPLTGEAYEVTVDGGIKVASPIKEEIKENRYLIFAFRAKNHGYVEDGVPSWK